MRIQVVLSIGKHRFLLRGIAGVLLLAGILSVLHILAGSLEPQEAESRIRDYLRWRLVQQHLTELDLAGRRAPDLAMAVRWKEQNEELDSLKFVEVDVRRCLFVRPFRRRSNFIVRVVIQDVDNQEQIRYFRFNGVYMGVMDITETGELAWRLPI